jgi:RNA polymerase sigma-70 factor (ECF subfamily)
MSHDDKIVFDKFTQGIIRRKIKQLVGRAGLTRQDREDLEQELILRLLQSLHLFDPDKAHRNVFVTTVIERAVAMILRERLAKKRNGGAVQSLDHAREKTGDSTEPVDPRRSHEEQVDLALDLAESLAKLPDDLRDLAERLKTQSLSQAARDLGVQPSTLQRRVQRLRRCSEDAGLRIYL